MKLGVVPVIVQVMSKTVPRRRAVASKKSFSSIVTPVAAVCVMTGVPITVRLTGSTCSIFTVMLGVVPETTVTFNIDFRALAKTETNLFPVIVSACRG